MMFEHFLMLFLFPVFINAGYWTGENGEPVGAGGSLLACTKNTVVGTCSFMSCDTGKGPTVCAAGECHCIHGYHKAGKEDLCVPCQPRSEAEDIGRACTDNAECSTGYCHGTWATGTCAKRMADGEKAALDLVGETIADSCASGTYVCGICGKQNKIGQACDYSSNCEPDAMCSTQVGFTCTGTCVACPAECGKNGKPRGCHNALITGTVECGKMTLSDKFEDLGEEMAAPLENLASCIGEATGLKMPQHKEKPKELDMEAKRVRRILAGVEEDVAAAAAKKTLCVSRNRDTGGTCHFQDCAEWRGHTYCDGGYCICKHGTYAKEVTMNGAKQTICVQCPNYPDGGNNDGDKCSEDKDCTSGFCSGQYGGAINAIGLNIGTCKAATACYSEIRKAANSCTTESCDVTIGKGCLSFKKSFSIQKKGSVNTTNTITQIDSHLGGKSTMDISWSAYGKASTTGYGEAHLNYNEKTFTARLRKAEIKLKAGVEFDVKVEHKYIIKETKIDLAPKQVIFLGAFMAGPAPVFVNIWAQPVAYYEFAGVMKADAKVKLDFTGRVYFKKDLEISLNLGEGAKETVEKVGFEMDNIQEEKSVKQFWDMNGSANMNLKVKVAVIFSISVEGFQFQLQPGLAGSVMVAADANAHNNKACGKKGGLSVQAEASLSAFLTGDLNFNPLERDMDKDKEQHTAANRRMLAATTTTEVPSVKQQVINAANDQVDELKGKVKGEMKAQQKNAANQISKLGKQYYVPNFLVKDATDAVQMDPAEAIEEMKKMDANQMKDAALAKVKSSIDVIELIHSGCELFFDLFNRFLGSKYKSCKEVAQYKETICGGIVKVANFFKLAANIDVAANLLSHKWEWKLAYYKLPDTCAVSWDADALDKKIKDATGGILTRGDGKTPALPKPKAVSLEQFVALSEDDTLFSFSIIVAACTVSFLLVSWFFYRKFQEGDQYVSYVALLDDVAPTTEAI